MEWDDLKKLRKSKKKNTPHRPASNKKKYKPSYGECAGKKTYASMKAAKHACRLMRKGGAVLHPYWCHGCGKIHLGSRTGGTRKKNF